MKIKVDPILRSTPEPRSICLERFPKKDRGHYLDGFYLHPGSACHFMVFPKSLQSMNPGSEVIRHTPGVQTTIKTMAAHTPFCTAQNGHHQNATLFMGVEASKGPFHGMTIGGNRYKHDISPLHGTRFHGHV